MLCGLSGLMTMKHLASEDFEEIQVEVFWVLMLCSFVVGYPI
jgi:hypothetical protein